MARQTAQAMDYLHAKKIVHRDLKSANLLLSVSRDYKVEERLMLWSFVLTSLRLYHTCTSPISGWQQSKLPGMMTTKVKTSLVRFIGW